MQVMRVILSVIDFDSIGVEGIMDVIENTKYPNYCIYPNVQSIEVRDIGEWSDDHPLNHGDTATSEFNRLFSDTK